MKDYKPTPCIIRKRHNSEQTPFERELNFPFKACGSSNYVSCYCNSKYTNRYVSSKSFKACRHVCVPKKNIRV